MLDELFPYTDPAFEAWQRQLQRLPAEPARVRRAEPTAADGRALRWIQMTSESMFIQSVDDNVRTINKKIVLLAEIGGLPIGFGIAAVGRYAPDHLFIQRVAVDPLARRRGAGFALLRAVARTEPGMNLAGATLVDDAATQAMNRKLAASLNMSVRDVVRRRFTRTDLGLGEHEQHQPWVIAQDGDGS